MNPQPFIRGHAQNHISPLQTCLPSFRPGVVKAWLNQAPSRSGMLLCPFGSAPQVALEAARDGHQVLIPVHNPILRFYLESQAHPPSREALSSALARLSSSYRGKDRLQPLILSLYETDCPQCGRKTSASSFTWSRHRHEPVQKTCRCSRCGEETRGEVSSEDIHKALGFQHNSPTFARALTRVAAPDDPIRAQVENALSSYPPRSVYALFTVWNKLASFNLPAEETAHLETLLLHAFYRCRQPLDPRLDDKDPGEFYREENVWYALEEAPDIWSGSESKLPVTTWPELPPQSGGICIFPGRIRELSPQLGEVDLKMIVMVFPKPSPSFWALSALWTGWLWGQEAAAPLRSILSIKNFDWPWMTRAIHLTLSEIHDCLPSGTEWFGLLPDLEKKSLLSSISAGASAGLKLEYSTLDPDLNLGQTVWTSQKGIFDPNSPEDPRQIIRTAGFDLLKEAGEPCHSLSVYNAGMAALASRGYPGEKEDPDIYFPRLVKDFENNIAYRQGYLHFPDSENWWHQELSLSDRSLSDRVEKIVVEILVKADGPLSEEEIFDRVSREFPPLLTPRQELIQACLLSYAEPAGEIVTGWALKPNEEPGRRVEDLAAIETLLIDAGKELGYRTSKKNAPGRVIHLYWEQDRSPSCSFFISASGMLGRILEEQANSADLRWIILPGSRAGLVHYKLQNNPPLAEVIEQEWGLVKFRQIRRLAETRGLDFLKQLDLDPFQSDTPQLPLI